jgi:hypothetical protein
VFPRTDVRTLRRLSDMGDRGDEAPPCGNHSATAPDDDGRA